MNRSVILTGTAIEEAPSRRLTAGALEATFDSGALRWIRWNGVEILRAILFLVRTPGWGTPAPAISNLRVSEEADGFHISYNAYYGSPSNGITAEIRLDGRADGHVTASAQIRADVPFLTNRTGFVILHPLDGFAGTEVEVEHASAEPRRLTIPAQISPGQPLMDIRAITHTPRNGLRITTRFDGDIFEMEDHRNWSDASFKTYSRPIGLPYPYLLQPDAPVSQSVTVTIADDGAVEPVEPSIAIPSIDGQILPAYALPLDRLEDCREALRFGPALAAIKPQRILLRFDSTRGGSTDDMDALADLLRLTGATLEVQVLLASDDPATSEAHLAQLAQAFLEAGVEVAEISAFAKIDEQSFQPGERRPPHLSETDIAASLARTFPGSRRGGGTPAFFTEFNRKRPDPAQADFLTFATTPVVHAADDASVMETLQSLPHILSSARRLAGGRPLAVGPVGIGARINPYGAAPTENPPDQREGMAARDPRQRGLFAAAWHVGYLARLAPWSVERFAFGAPVGPFGLLSSVQNHDRAGWDQWPEGARYPLYHVASWIAAGAGGRVIAADNDTTLARLVWEKNGRRHALFANLADASVSLDLGAYPDRLGQILDETSAEDAAVRADAFAVAKVLPDTVVLGGYGVAHIDYGVDK